MTLLIFSLLGGGYYKKSSMRIIIRIEVHSTNSDCMHGRRNKKGYRTVKGNVLNDDKTFTAVKSKKCYRQFCMKVKQ